MVKKSDAVGIEAQVKTEEFTNSIGITVTLKGVPPLLVPRIQKSIKFPEKPTYTVKLVTGDEQTFEHDEKSLTTPEDKAAWEKYIEDQKTDEQELSQKTMNAILVEGVSLDETKLDLVRWKKRQEMIGVPVSDDVEEMLQHYKETEVVKNNADMRHIMERVMAITGVSKESIEAAKASFPGDVEPEA
jgi:hypothetical protein